MIEETEILIIQQQQFSKIETNLQKIENLIKKIDINTESQNIDAYSINKIYS